MVSSTSNNAVCSSSKWLKKKTSDYKKCSLPAWKSEHIYDFACSIRVGYQTIMIKVPIRLVLKSYTCSSRFGLILKSL